MSRHIAINPTCINGPEVGRWEQSPKDGEQEYMPTVLILLEFPHQQPPPHTNPYLN